ncbi:ATP phosphoribosyltransferase [Ornithinibacillus gellani]|uniref:ATP phosphoribosyltransferase n=1 Tax=Ornithinibacillus gellani TaxID=2293253 RepID=UPI000F492E52|nr:ATP phosphoribosyltransferase [Ornithinibacillus gellani]TQS76488.1 ATP phosphoribosyltransferase [Ornithinibacillus gellani]
MEMLTLALAKGRIAKDAISLLEQAGIQFDDFHDQTRKLVFQSADGKYRLLFVKAVDVPTYVETGAADIGIVGKDTIMEAGADVYELLDLGLGACQFVVAGLGDSVKRKQRLTVASKYPVIATQFFERKNIPIETIKLNGSVELAPLIGMADVIVDIVETGTTIKENGLSIIEEVETISTRLIANKASFATKTKATQQFIMQLEAILEGNQ